MLPSHIPPDVPFSLVCQTCDGGMEIESYEAALAAGWTEICYAPDLPMAYFLGLCPRCRQWQEAEELRRSAPPATE
jgi:hypothetical protein